MLPSLEIVSAKLSTGVIITDRRGQILDANAAFCMLLGYSVAQLANRKLESILYRENYEDEAECLRPLLVEVPLPTLQWEKRFVHRDRSLVWMHVSLRKVFDEVTQAWYGVFMTLDLSEQKHIEKEFLKYLQLRELLFNEIDQRVTSNQMLLEELIHQHVSQHAGRRG